MIYRHTLTAARFIRVPIYIILAVLIILPGCAGLKHALQIPVGCSVPLPGSVVATSNTLIHEYDNTPPSSSAMIIPFNFFTIYFDTMLQIGFKGHAQIAMIEPVSMTMPDGSVIHMVFNNHHNGHQEIACDDTARIDMIQNNYPYNDVYYSKIIWQTNHINPDGILYTVTYTLSDGTPVEVMLVYKNNTNALMHGHVNPRNHSKNTALFATWCDKAGPGKRRYHGFHSSVIIGGNTYKLAAFQPIIPTLPLISRIYGMTAFGIGISTNHSIPYTTPLSSELPTIPLLSDYRTADSALVVYRYKISDYSAEYHCFTSTNKTHLVSVIEEYSSTQTHYASIVFTPPLHLSLHASGIPSTGIFYFSTDTGIRTISGYYSTAPFHLNPRHPHWAHHRTVTSRYTNAAYIVSIGQ